MPAPFNPSTIDAYQAIMQGIRVTRPTAIVPASGVSHSLFQNSGPVLLTGLIGRATAAADANAELIKVFIGAAGATDISAVSTTVATMVIGSLFYITGVFATALAMPVADLRGGCCWRGPVPQRRAAHVLPHEEHEWRRADGHFRHLQDGRGPGRGGLGGRTRGHHW